MKNMKKIIIQILLILMYSLGWGATYYVDSSVTDTYVASATPDFTTYNPVTFATDTGSDLVYKTIADLNVKTWSAGDFIYFRKGQTWTEQLNIAQSGSAGLPITFDAYGTGAKPIIDADDTRNYCILASDDLSYITLKNLAVKDSVLYNIRFPGTTGSHIVMSGVDSSGGAAGISVLGKSNSNYSDIAVTGNTAATRAGFGLSGAASDITLLRISVSTSAYRGFALLNITGLTGSYLTAFENTDTGLILDSCDTVNLSYCTLYDNTLSGFDTPTTNTDVTLDHFNVYGNAQDGIAFHGETLGTNIVQYAIIHDNGGAGATSGDGFTLHSTASASLIYSILYNNWKSGIAITGSGSGNIYNNTIYNNYEASVAGNYGMVFQSATGTWDIRNNIVKHHELEMSVDNGCTGTAAWTIDNNLYHDSRGGNAFTWKATNGNFAAWQGASGKDASSINADPQFYSVSTPDFRILGSSPAINKGVNVSLVLDYEGKTVPHGIGELPDIGAYEFYPYGNIPGITTVPTGPGYNIIGE